MHPSRLPILLLAAPLLLSACGGSSEQTVQIQRSSSARSVPPVSQTVLFAGLRSAYTIARTATGYTVTSKAQVPVGVAVSSTARLRFADTSIALDLDGVAGKAYRAYQAAFGRTPDIAGLSYWITAMDNGASADAVATEFVKSEEFKAVYGAAPTNADIVTRLYINVLHRPGDPAGIYYWMSVLDKKQATVAQVLAGFAESAENKDGAFATTQLGIAYQEPSGTYSPATAASGLEYVQGTFWIPGTKDGAASVYNEQGAKGLAYVGEMGLYAKAGPATYSYEFSNVAKMNVAARLALWDQWGAKGYLYKTTDSYANGRGRGYLDQWATDPDSGKTVPVTVEMNDSIYDIFVKGSSRNTTYSYRLVAESRTPEKLNAHGAQGYAYQGRMLIDLVFYNLYVKDKGSDAIYDYAVLPGESSRNGLLKQMNEKGTQGYGFLDFVGPNIKNGPSATVYMRSSASPGPFTYTMTPLEYNTTQAMLDDYNAKAVRGEAFWGYLFLEGEPVSLFYKGGWITNPELGPLVP